jgi:hypothetical protein
VRQPKALGHIPGPDPAPNGASSAELRKTVKEMITDFTLDAVTLALVVIVFLPFFTWLSLKAFEQRRYGKFGYCTILSIYVLRLAYLRVSTNGGKITIYDPSVFSFSRELGDPVVFFALTLALLLTAVHRMHDDEVFYSKNYVKREHYDELNRKYEMLLREGNSGDT